jgi:SAM-dependent methyltransferase
VLILDSHGWFWILLEYLYPLQTLPWYNCWFGSDYLELYRHRSPQEATRTVSWLTSWLEIKPPARVLDLACGNCRHGAEFARLGFKTFGFDLSWPLLKSVPADDLACRPLQRTRGDMRLLPFASNRFDLVLSLFTSFGYFKESADDLQVLAEVKRVLKSNSMFLLDFLNARLIKQEIIPAESGKIGDREVIIERWLDGAQNRVEKRISIKSPLGKIQEYRESVRLYDLEELKQMLAQSGIYLKQIFGDYGGADYNDKSPRLILIGVKSA